MRYTREQVQANREAWLAFLREEGRQKCVGRLEDTHEGERRCCLGHAAFVLGGKRSVIEGTAGDKIVAYNDETGYLSADLAEMLNMEASGDLHDFIHLDGYEDEDGDPINFGTLTGINDDSDLTPAQIADVIENQIEADNLRELYDFDNHAPTP